MPEVLKGVFTCRETMLLGTISLSTSSSMCTGVCSITKFGDFEEKENENETQLARDSL